MKLLSVQLLYSVKDTDVDSHLCNMSRSMKTSNGVFLRQIFTKKIVKLLSCKTVVMCVLTLPIYFLLLSSVKAKSLLRTLLLASRCPVSPKFLLHAYVFAGGVSLCHSCLLSSFMSSLSLFTACLASGRPCPQCQRVTRKVNAQENRTLRGSVAWPGQV